jgi:general secretion pathway protein A
MYAQHFGLTQNPFSIAPDPRYLFMSERHREALAHLLYGVGGGGGFVLLTGDIGAGKTTVCRCFLEQIPPHCQVAYIFNPKLTVTELLQSICDEFHLTVPPSIPGPCSLKDYIDGLNTFLLQAHAQGRNNVLIIDEAQNLSADVLEQLRLLTNLETNERKLLQIVLIGQPELRAMLARPELEQLAQRVIARFHLDALSEAETVRYIQHRLQVAGHQGHLPFDAASLHCIWQHTRGVPRRINLLCDRALLGAWTQGALHTHKAMIQQAAAEVFGTVPRRTRLLTFLRYTLIGAGLAAVVLATTNAAGWWSWPRKQAAAGATTVQEPPSTPIAQPTAPASAPNTPPPAKPVPQPISHSSLDDGLQQQLLRDLPQAWSALAPAWGWTPGTLDSCADAPNQAVQCLRIGAGSANLPLLRQLNRPGIISLQPPTATAPRYAVLVGLTPDSATLRLNGQLHQLPLVALVSAWRGDFATYWRVPPGYTAINGTASSSPALAPLTLSWLRTRLAQWNPDLPSSASTPAHPTDDADAALRHQILAFQRSQGLQADGTPGPMTLMQLARVTGTDEPRLTSEP